MGIDTDNLIPRNGLEAWHKYVAGQSGHEIIYDYSGNDRHIDVDPGDAPVLTDDVINGRPAWYFDGTGEALVYTGSVSVKTAFVLASFEDATLPSYEGVLTGKTNSGAASGIVVLGDTGTDEIYDNTGLVADLIYRKNGVVFAAGNYKAPVDGVFGLMEIQSATGMTLDGIQVGVDRTHSDRKLKGYFVEQLIYSRVPSESERRDVYEYFATMFARWQQNAAGLNVWPFEPNWTFPHPVDKRVIGSESVSGAFTGRSKGTMKQMVEPRFESRTADEYDAAVAFWNQHYPGSNFIFRDVSFSPARDTEMRFISRLDRNGESFQDHTYTWQAVEA